MRSTRRIDPPHEPRRPAFVIQKGLPFLLKSALPGLEESSVEQSTVTGCPEDQILSEGKKTKNNNFVSERFKTELGAAKGDKEERLPASVLQMSKTAA
jgi:hypothetical protein